MSATQLLSLSYVEKPASGWRVYLGAVCLESRVTAPATVSPRPPNCLLQDGSSSNTAQTGTEDAWNWKCKRCRLCKVIMKQMGMGDVNNGEWWFNPFGMCHVKLKNNPFLIFLLSVLCRRWWWTSLVVTPVPDRHWKWINWILSTIYSPLPGSSTATHRLSSNITRARLCCVNKCLGII